MKKILVILTCALLTSFSLIKADAGSSFVSSACDQCGKKKLQSIQIDANSPLVNSACDQCGKKKLNP